MQNISTKGLIFLAIVLSVVGVILWSISEHYRVAAIDSYDACASAGYPILESHPSQCRTPDGRTFVNPHEQAMQAPATTAASSTPAQQTGEGCIVGGCSKEICSDAAEGPMVSTCIYKQEFACYKSARCERQANGRCGWTQTQELLRCLSSKTASSASEMPQ